MFDFATIQEFPSHLLLLKSNKF